MKPDTEAAEGNTSIEPWKQKLRKTFVRGGLFLGRFSIASVKHLGRAIAYGVVGGLLVLVVVAVLYLNHKPDLSPWHEIELDEEFTKSSEVDTFGEYLELEERLFAELEEKIYQEGGGKDFTISRYHRGSLADPTSYETNWNRTFE